MKWSHVTAIAVVWACFGCLAYSYVVYPCLIWGASRLWPRLTVAPSVTDRDLPSVSFLIAAFDEQDVIGARIENALTIDYPAGRFEVVVASDGSADATNSRVQEASRRSSQVKLLAYPVRSGKSSVLNRAIPGLTGDIVVLSDANTCTDPNAARRLARWFSIPDVGAVCGQLQLVDPQQGRNVDSLYWKYENFLKACEGKLDALLGANGGIYAIRRSDFRPIPADTLVDDLVIPLTIKLERGRSIVYDSSAVASEETPVGMDDEFRRRARIGAGGFQTIARLWPLLNPARGWIAMAFWSHKVLRWCGPFFLIGFLAGNCLLVKEPIYRGTLVAQVSFYALAGLGRFVPGRGITSRLLRLPALFASVNVGLFIGFWRWVQQRQHGVWERTVR